MQKHLKENPLYFQASNSTAMPMPALSGHFCFVVVSLKQVSNGKDVLSNNQKFQI